MRVLSSTTMRLALSLAFLAAFMGVGNAPASAHRLNAGSSLPVLRYDAEVGNATWPATLDPAVATDGYSISVFDLVYAELVKLDYHTYKVLPDLATHWTVSKNHRVYWFYLRHNARFSNGDPVTAQDEVWSLTRILARATNSPIAMLYFGHILGAKRLNDGKTNTLQGVRALGKYVVQITLDKPIAYFLQTFSYWAAKTLDPRIVAGKKPTVYLTNVCSAGVGAGPFMYKCRNTSASKSSFYPPGTTPTITLVPNPYYYGRKPHIQIVIQPYATTEVGYRAFQANQLDVTPLPAPDVAGWRGKSGLAEMPSPSIYYLLPNFQARPFNNAHCRLAVADALDQNTINNVLLHHTQLNIYSFVPKPIPGAYPGNDNPHYDLALARKELAQCPGGLHGLTLPYWRAGTDADNMFAAMQSMWQRVGIDIKPRGLLFNDWLNVVHTPENQTHNTIVEDEWGMDYPDPQDFCTLLLRGGSVENVGQYNDPTYNRLVDTADVTLNQSHRIQLYIRAQHRALSSGAAIMIGQLVQDAAIKPWVHGLIAAYGNTDVAPAGGDWANVSISRH